MSDPVSPIVAATEVLSLTSALARLIEEAKASPSSQKALVEILNSLRGESIGIAKEMENQLREMLEVFDKEKVPLDKSIPQLIEDLSWYNFLTRRRLNAAREKFYAMHRALTSFLDDITAVLVCAGTTDSARGAFWSCQEEKEKLDKLIASRPPLRTLIETMISMASTVQARLQAGGPKP